MPECEKSHRYYDILPLCITCHKKYELEASNLKNELSIKYNLNQHPTFSMNKELSCAKRASVALLKNKEKIPENRKNVLYSHIQIYLKITEIPTDIQLFEITKLNVYTKTRESNFGEEIVKKVDFQEFTEMWRKHFMDTMNPQFMPEYWSLNRPYLT